ncbi:hypothetical protein, partial [Streptomyces gilvus]|uniref:hypothetical protein n=1 Tax=Streptomyces gilvus TaxID=2920937 RepID=UPI001F113A05
LSKIRKGIKARGSTYRKLERALQWEAGSVAAILAGGDPLLTAGHAGDVAGVEGEVARSADGQALSLRDLEILQDLVVSTASRLGLTEEETDEAYRRARVELERRRSVEAESPSPSPRRRSVG